MHIFNTDLLPAKLQHRTPLPTAQIVRFISVPLILSLSGRSTNIICLFTLPVRNLQRCTAPQNRFKIAVQLNYSCLEAKQQLNSSCSEMQKRCAAFEALGSSFAAQLPTFKCCELVAVTLQFSCARSDSSMFLSAHNMNRQKSLLRQITAFITRKL